MKLYLYVIIPQLKKHGLVITESTPLEVIDIFLKYIRTKLLRKPLFVEYFPTSDCEGWRKEQIGKPQQIRVFSVYPFPPADIPPYEPGKDKLFPEKNIIKSWGKGLQFKDLATQKYRGDF